MSLSDIVFLIDIAAFCKWDSITLLPWYVTPGGGMGVWKLPHCFENPPSFPPPLPHPLTFIFFWSECKFGKEEEYRIYQGVLTADFRLGFPTPLRPPPPTLFLNLDAVLQCGIISISRYKKNLKALYLVHPTNFIKLLWNIFKPFIRWVS